MTRATLLRWGFIIGFLISLPLVVSAEEYRTAPSSLAKEVKGQNAQAGQVTKTLLYQPPRGLGAPSAGRRVGGVSTDLSFRARALVSDFNPKARARARNDKSLPLTRFSSRRSS